MFFSSKPQCNSAYVTPKSRNSLQSKRRPSKVAGAHHLLNRARRFARSIRRRGRFGGFGEICKVVDRNGFGIRAATRSEIETLKGRELSKERDAYAKAKLELNKERDAHAVTKFELSKERDAHARAKGELYKERDAHAVAELELSKEREAHARTEIAMSQERHAHTSTVSDLTRKHTSELAVLQRKNTRLKMSHDDHVWRVRELETRLRRSAESELNSVRIQAWTNDRYTRHVLELEARMERVEIDREMFSQKARDFCDVLGVELPPPSDDEDAVLFSHPGFLPRDSSEAPPGTPGSQRP